MQSGKAGPNLGYKMYIRAASIVIERMIAKAESQLHWLRRNLGTGTKLESDLCRDWEQRISDEIEHRNLQLQRLNWGLQNGGLMNDADGSALVSAAQAVHAVTSAGVLSANVPAEHRRLTAAATKFRASLEKRLI